MLRISLLLLFCLGLSATTFADAPPNILWITAEDMSPSLGCYGDDYAVTPHIDQLSKESVRYTQAFATAPVCSPSRSCLITGCYATSLGTHNMRSSFPLPKSMTGFPSRLRQSGWYTSNNVKTDYNTGSSDRVMKSSWDESSPTAHWRKRKGQQQVQPFFSVFNIMTSHQSRTMVWPYAQFQKEVQSHLAKGEIHDPVKAPVPPYYPETKLIRREIARYYDCVTAMDQQVGEILEQLKEDGLAEQTIVFFYSDHGSGMPRHKRTLLDSGMRVPLLVRFPKKYQHLAPSKPGTTTDRLVSFVDFGPTVLSLAGIDVPDEMQGEPFLGEQQREPRKYVFGHRDRVDEVMDTARSVRDKKYLYIRNYQPHLGYNQPSAWPEQGEIRQEFNRLVASGKMTPTQKHFAGPTRPIEELYDCKNDPLNLTNLATSGEFATTLLRLRNVLDSHLKNTLDKGFVPETTAWRELGDNSAWKAGEEKLKQMYLDGIAAAWHVGMKDQDYNISQLKNGGEVERYWAAISFCTLAKLDDASIDSLSNMLSDDSIAVRLAAADALARHGKTDAALMACLPVLKSKDVTEVMYAMRTIELMGVNARDAIPAVQDVVTRMAEIRGPNTDATVVLSKDQDLAMFVEFSANAFLKRVSHTEERESLFDGKTLQGWSARAEGDVKVVDGEIQILSKGKNLWLIHDKTYADFELTVEAMMPKDGYNSGIGFRCIGDKGKPKGYQCEIENAKSGMIYAIGSGWVWPKGAEQTKRFQQMSKNAFILGEWNSFRIRCEGNRIQIWVNDVKTADVKDERFASGSIALQHHGKGDVHRFRNIKIKELHPAE